MANRKKNSRGIIATVIISTIVLVAVIILLLILQDVFVKGERTCPTYVNGQPTAGDVEYGDNWVFIEHGENITKHPVENYYDTDWIEKHCDLRPGPV